MSKPWNNCLGDPHEYLHSFYLLWDNLEKIWVQIKSVTKTKKYEECMCLLNGSLKQAKLCVYCKPHQKKPSWPLWGTLKKSLSWFDLTELSAWGYDNMNWCELHRSHWSLVVHQKNIVCNTWFYVLLKCCWLNVYWEDMGYSIISQFFLGVL